MKILRRRSKKRYLGKKRVYEYERFSVDIPAKFGDAVETFLNKDPDMAVKKEDDDTLVIVLAPRENVSVPRNVLPRVSGYKKLFINVKSFFAPFLW